MKLLYEDLTYKIRKAVFNVYNTLGYGHKEQIYQKALLKEFTHLNIPFEEEVNLDVFYNNDKIGFYRADFVINSKIIIELKAVELMPKTFEIQLLHYLKSTKFELGLLINFGAPKLQIKRLVWTSNDLRESASHP
jgi:GxxExxY protein